MTKGWCTKSMPQSSTATTLPLPVSGRSGRRSGEGEDQVSAASCDGRMSARVSGANTRDALRLTTQSSSQMVRIFLRCRRQVTMSPKRAMIRASFGARPVESRRMTASISSRLSVRRISRSAGSILRALRMREKQEGDHGGRRPAAMRWGSPFNLSWFAGCSGHACGFVPSAAARLGCHPLWPVPRRQSG